MYNQINDNNLNTEQSQSKKNNRGLFYGVIAISTFIIMAVGATFAYFAATANSGNNSIQTSSSSLSLTLFSYETAWKKDDLIPVDTNVLKYSFEKQDDTTIKVEKKECFNSEDESVDCEDESVDESKTKITYASDKNNTICVDDYGNNICSVYVFQIVNDNPSPQTMSFSIVSEVNTFSNLMAAVYEVNVSDEETYNSDSNNNKTGDPTEFNVMRSDDNGYQTANDGEYTPIYVNRKGVKKTLLRMNNEEAADRGIIYSAEGEASVDNVGSRSTQIANNIAIDSNETKTFAVLVYIHNLEQAQKEDENKIFTGAINVTTGDGTTGVSGYISAANG